MKTKTKTNEGGDAGVIGRLWLALTTNLSQTRMYPSKDIATIETEPSYSMMLGAIGVDNLVVWFLVSNSLFADFYAFTLCQSQGLLRDGARVPHTPSSSTNQKEMHHGALHRQDRTLF